jgi:hypothetical protein
MTSWAKQFVWKERNVRNTPVEGLTERSSESINCLLAVWEAIKPPRAQISEVQKGEQV